MKFFILRNDYLPGRAFRLFILRLRLIKDTTNFKHPTLSGS